jgi:PadR family transcriptional regulator
MKRDGVRGHLRTLLLGSIAAGEPLHGYALITTLSELTDGLFSLNEGAVYPVLHQLESDGLVSSTWDTSAARRRRLYRLTESGRQALRDEAEDWRQFREAIDVVLKEVPWLTTN